METSHFKIHYFMHRNTVHKTVIKMFPYTLSTCVGQCTKYLTHTWRF